MKDEITDMPVLNSADLIGVVIVVHNRKDDLLRLLDSLQKQAYSDYEILIIDNGSTDGLSDISRLPSVEYMRLEENIGAAKGFNCGIRHMLQKNKYDYLWLLDSDLLVGRTALSELVKIMESDDAVGICGSIIYNIYDPGIVVEAGANIDLKRGLVISHYCNQLRGVLPDVLDVDYVGSGVSLLRTEMISQIGLFDERYYFLWEDMDYGLLASRNGWKVVVSTSSEVYHPPFTEKRNPNIYAYYGVRNPLLTVAKYSSKACMPYYLLINLCRYLRIGLLMLFSGRKKFAQLSFRAISDYVAGRFGKAALMEVDQTGPSMEMGVLKREKRVVILGLEGKSAVQSAVEFVKASCSGEIIVVAQNYRRELLGDLEVDRIITYDDRAPGLFREYWKAGRTIMRLGGCVINTDLTVVSPLCYFGYRTFDWDHRERGLFRSRFGLLAAWRPAAAVVLAPLLALFILPSVWLASLKHKAKQPVLP